MFFEYGRRGQTSIEKHRGRLDTKRVLSRVLPASIADDHRQFGR